ncbi:MAG: glycoside hydrolase, partial [Steroidobacteraceae bacterium]|nr:glycoside hydrolase [Steroidobacteraceae bacterium]
MSISIRLNHVARCVLATMTLSAICATAFADSLDLSGAWEVELESGAKHSIALPGSLQANRIGDPISVATKWTGGIFNRAWYDEPEYAAFRKPDNLKIPFWLQPDTHYVGAATYRRRIEIPSAWSGRRIVLTLERPHWKTTVWLDEQRIGSNDAMSVAHDYDLGINLPPGPHSLTVRVDNTHDPDIGENSHSISDHTQGNWNGIVGRVALSSTSRVWIQDVVVTTRIVDRTVLITGSLGRVGAEPWPRAVRIQYSPAAGAATDAVVASDGRFAATYSFGKKARLWDEFEPALYSVVVTLTNGERREIPIGFREIRVDGRQLVLNDEPLYLRGTLDVAAFPRTGHAPTDVDSWKKVFGQIKSHGLNHVRFHSWCPPEAAFIAADQLGVYLQVEAATWPNWSTTIGDGKPVDAWVEAETSRILRAYGNHPSFIMFTNGNEPGGAKHAQWLAAWVKRHKAADPRRLYNAGAGWPEIPENDYHLPSEPRIQHWLEGLRSRVNARPPETRTDYGGSVRAKNRPLISHEIGQWAVFPNFSEMPKYTGYLKPRNFEIFRETLAANGLAAREHDFLMASGKLQALLYKEEIESALRTPEFGGFQLLSLQDFPGQGTALVGILDAFWEEKGYISPKEFRRFSGSIVPLARLDKRVFMKNEQLVADIELSNFGPAALSGATTSWQLVDVVGKVVARGQLPARN